MENNPAPLSITNFHGTESQRTPDQVSGDRAVFDTQVLSGSVQWVLLEISWIIGFSRVPGWNQGEGVFLEKPFRIPFGKIGVHLRED